MTDAQQREAARLFFYKWNGKGKEDEDARSYWILCRKYQYVLTKEARQSSKKCNTQGNTKKWPNNFAGTDAMNIR